MTQQFTVKQLADHLNATLVGDADQPIVGLADIASAKTNHIAFLDNPKYKKFLATTEAGALLVSEAMAPAYNGTKLICDDPYLAFAKVAALFSKEPVAKPGIHSRAVIGEQCSIADTAAVAANAVLGDNVQIADGVVIGAGCVIGDGVSIGKNSQLFANVTVYYGCSIGENTRIHSGTVIGTDGFGYAHQQGQWHKIPQIGSVRIGSNVEIGSNTTIDCGAIGDTVIGNGVIIDNQVQIAHNVEIGDHTAIAGCVGIAGSAKIGKHCRIAGMAAIAGHLEIVDGVVITGGGGVNTSIRTPGIYSSGVTVQPHKQWCKNAARLSMLDGMARRIKSLEKLQQEKIDG